MSGMKDMTEGSVTRHLLHMASFMAVSMVVQTLYLLADLYWVGTLGKEAIAAVGLSGNLMMVVLALTQMLGVGTTTVISQAAGRKDQAHAELGFNQSIVLSLVVALLVGVCSFPFRQQYSVALSADAPTAKLAASYLVWFIPSLMLQFPLVSLGSALRATGIIKPAVGLQVLSVILNIIFAPLLIFGIGPFPRMGVAGAALSTFVAILIANVLTILYFEKSFRYLRFRVSQWKPQLKIWWSILRIGIPAGAEFALMAVYIVVVYIIIRRFIARVPRNGQPLPPYVLSPPPPALLRRAGRHPVNAARLPYQTSVVSLRCHDPYPGRGQSPSSPSRISKAARFSRRVESHDGTR